MNKYVLLIILNAPLALYGLFNVVLTYKLKRIRRSQAAIRVLFWLAIIAGLWFAKPLTEFLWRNELTDSPPLSIFDVLLTTGIIICFLLIAQAYSRVAELENRLTNMHEKLSILLSKHDK